MLIGLVYIRTGFSVSAKLRQLKCQLQSDEMVRRHFEKAVADGGSADRDGDGRLDVEELKGVMKELGTALSDKEAELLLVQAAGRQQDGKIGLDEFRGFMVRRAAAPTTARA